MLEPLKELLFPVHCYGCKTLGLEICSKCRKFWSPHFYIKRFEDLTTYSSIQYSPIAKSILLSAKEDSIRRADQMIVDVLVDLVKRIPAPQIKRALLIPIPGSKRAVRKRGRDFISSITKELSNRTGIPTTNALQINRSLIDQSRLNANDRYRNISGAFDVIEPDIDDTDYVDLPLSDIANREIFLVDDLVTSGATLLEAKRALNSHGIRVNLAITACVAQTLNIGG